MPNACGGNATVHNAPIDCVGSSLIDGTLVTAHVEESHGLLTVTYSFDQARVADTDIRIRWHVGISSTNAIPAETQGIIPAGQTVGVLQLTSPVCAGQVDVKAIFIANGDARGRVTAPWITDTECQTVTTTTTTTPGTTTTTPSATTTTVPGQTTTTVPFVSVATTVPGTIPRTGADSNPVAGLGVGIALVGVLFIASTRRGGAWLVRKFGR